MQSRHFCSMKPNRFIIMALTLLVTGATAWAERMTIAVPVANIRSGPGSQYDIIWNVEQYHPIDVLEKSGPWYHFRDFEGDEGWVHNSLVDNIASVITTNESCNIRSGPGTNFQIVFTVGRGIPFKILQRKGNWIHIRHADGEQGWIHKSLVW